jgi:hypothetical protein
VSHDPKPSGTVVEHALIRIDHRSVVCDVMVPVPGCDTHVPRRSGGHDIEHEDLETALDEPIEPFPNGLTPHELTRPSALSGAEEGCVGSEEPQEALDSPAI